MSYQKERKITRQKEKEEGVCRISAWPIYKKQPPQAKAAHDILYVRCLIHIRKTMPLSPTLKNHHSASIVYQVIIKHV